MRTFLSLVALAFFIAACGGNPDPAPTPLPVNTVTPSTMLVPLSTQASVPTQIATTADSVGWTPTQVVAAFKAAGLEAESPTPMDRKDYGMAPLVGEGVHFLVPSLCTDCGGRIIKVTDPTEREQLAEYYRQFGKISAALYSHVFIWDDIVVQINGDLADDEAAKYKAALESLKR